jgi:SAM-dependent methyltransferase
MLPLDKQNAYRARYAARTPGWRGSGPEFEALTRRSLSREARVLDLGCGRGGVMELFWRDARLSVGLDPDLHSLAENRTGMPLAGGQGDGLPFPARTFDLVLALWVLEHLPRPAAVFAEVSRVLRPGGHFIFLTPNGLHPMVWANRVNQSLPQLQRRLVPALYGRAESDTFRVHYRANSPARLRSLGAASQFSTASLRIIPDPSYLAFNDAFYALSVALERLLPAGWGVHLLGDFVKM